MMCSRGGNCRSLRSCKGSRKSNDRLSQAKEGCSWCWEVDVIVNISCPLRGKYQEAPAGIKRCLKLSMTDGVQHVFGREYRSIKDLKVLASAGLKVVIYNANIRCGLLMLVPEALEVQKALEVLGGTVQELKSAHQRLC